MILFDNFKLTLRCLFAVQNLTYYYTCNVNVNVSLYSASSQKAPVMRLFITLAHSVMILNRRRRILLYSKFLHFSLLCFTC